MKLIHLSDLHLGKRVNEFSMLLEQEYILERILHQIDEEQPDGVMIAGDVYDKPIPPIEAVALFDDFLVQLAARKLWVFVISGNHDSPERIAFGGRLMDKRGIYMSPVYRGQREPVVLMDAHGPVDIFMLPFIKPAQIRRFFPRETCESYTQALRIAIENLDLNPKHRNILITHQFVTGASRCESEDVSVGGADNVDADVFDLFDYVALGHLHGSQSVGRMGLRYCGSPLAYSFSEGGHEKSMTVVELEEKDQVSVRSIPLVPKRAMREIKGSYEEVTEKSFYEGQESQDYLHITLTDEEDVSDAMNKLRIFYPNLMRLDYDNKRTRSNLHVCGVENPEQKSLLALLCELYEKQNNQKMSEDQLAFSEKLIKAIWEGDEK